MRPFVFVLVLCGGAILAQVNPAPEGSVYKIGGGVSPPRIVSKVEPASSEEARRLVASSTVSISLVVGADGSIRDLKVARGAGFGLDEQAIAAVSQWRFQPSTKGGEPVAVYATVELNFKLLERDSPMARISYLPEGAARPVAIKGRFPKYKPPAPSPFHFTFDRIEEGAV